MLTEDEKKWLETKLVVIKCKPKLAYKIPSNKFRLKMFKLANHLYFDIFILICIGLNTLILALTWYDQPIIF